MYTYERKSIATLYTHLTGASSKQTTVAGDLYTHRCEDLPEFILSGLEAQVTHKHSPGLLRTLCLNLCCFYCWNLLTGQLYNASLCYNCACVGVCGHACVCGCVWACVCVARSSIIVVLSLIKYENWQAVQRTFLFLNRRLLII